MDEARRREVQAGWDAEISGTAVHADRLVHVEFTWGTAITVELRGTAGRVEAGRLAILRCREWFQEVDAQFSPFRADSQVTAEREGILGSASPDYLAVRKACQEARRLTLGAFDPWQLAGGYDPSGYVKGWAAGRASELLLDAGFANHIVNAGGDIACAGDADVGSGAGWPVGIVNPHDRSQVVAVVAVRDAAVATSGRYERGDHVIDPSSGLPAQAADSATVIGPDPGLADAAASAALVDGTACMAWFAALGRPWSVHLVIGEQEHFFGSAFESPADAPTDRSRE